MVEGVGDNAVEEVQHIGEHVPVTRQRDVEMNLRIRIHGGYYSSINDIIKEVNSELSKDFIDQSMIVYNDVFSQAPKVKYNENNKRAVVYVPAGYELTLPYNLQSILGFSDTQMPLKNLDKEVKAMKGENVCDIKDRKSTRLNSS